MSALINFVGDIAIFKRFESMGIDPFRATEMPEADRYIGNFEFPVPDGRKQTFYDVQSAYCPSYSYFKNLQLDKFSFLGIANNHVMDYGPDGVLDTVAGIENKGVKTFGCSTLDTFDILRFSVNGLTFAVIAFVKGGRWSRGNFGYGPNHYDLEKVLTLISELKTLVNHVIIFPHWGTELVAIPDPEDVKNARAFIDHGASVVVGHHPHVPQGIEEYNGGIIAYSLGSFIYFHEEELGYSEKKWDRHFSISLNIKFSKNSALEHDIHIYKYNMVSKLPEMCNTGEFDAHFFEISKKIGDKREYVSAVRKQLLLRELRSLFLRFKDDPVNTLWQYFRYLKFSHIRKILGF